MTTAIEKQENNALATVPEHLQQYMAEEKYRDQISMDDITIPRLGLAQGGLSPQLKKANESYIPGLQEGDLFNTATGQIYGPKVTVVPLFHFKNWIHFKDIKDGGGVIGQY